MGTNLSHRFHGEASFLGDFHEVTRGEVRVVVGLLSRRDAGIRDAVVENPHR
ncbi:hypothetical protein [Paraburkholderia sp. DGU8]|uniref:hypothetical protein n=1 Tax=Paraburkholderia sp. DGU8 TaxID=3161997 RepID=UPI003466D6E9